MLHLALLCTTFAALPLTLLLLQCASNRRKKERHGHEKRHKHARKHRHDDEESTEPRMKNVHKVVRHQPKDGAKGEKSKQSKRATAETMFGEEEDERQPKREVDGGGRVAALKLGANDYDTVPDVSNSEIWEQSERTRTNRLAKRATTAKKPTSEAIVPMAMKGAIDSLPPSQATAQPRSSAPSASAAADCATESHHGGSLTAGITTTDHPSRVADQK